MKPIAESALAQQRENFMDNLMRHGRTALQGVTDDPDVIDTVLCDLISLIIEDHPGQQIYIPTDYSHRYQERALAVYNACNGRNITEVAKQFGVSGRTIYRIYSRMLKEMRAKTQPDLFNPH